MQFREKIIETDVFAEFRLLIHPSDQPIEYDDIRRLVEETQVRRYIFWGIYHACPEPLNVIFTKPSQDDSERVTMICFIPRKSEMVKGVWLVPPSRSNGSDVFNVHVKLSKERTFHDQTHTIREGNTMIQLTGKHIDISGSWTAFELHLTVPVDKQEEEWKLVVGRIYCCDAAHQGLVDRNPNMV